MHRTQSYRPSYDNRSSRNNLPPKALTPTVKQQKAIERKQEEVPPSRDQLIRLLHESQLKPFENTGPHPLLKLIGVAALAIPLPKSLLFTIFLLLSLAEGAEGAPTPVVAPAPSFPQPLSTANQTQFTHAVCSESNMLPGNKNRQTRILAGFNSGRTRYELAEKFVNPGKPPGTWSKMNAERDKRIAFLNKSSRGKGLSEKTQKTIRNAREHCEVTKPLSKVNENLLQQFIYTKANLYHIVQDAYQRLYKQDDLPQSHPVGNCHEMTAQALLRLLTKLGPDEFFIQITSDFGSANHVHGIIVSKEVLKGHLIQDPVRKREFLRKISTPFFRDGNAAITLMGGGKNARERLTQIFLEAIGINKDGAVHKADHLADRPRLCDPYNHLACYLDDCSQEVIDSYFKAYTLDTITILAAEIPSELQSKISDELRCANEEINKKIQDLVDTTIEPAISQDKVEVKRTEF